jgi:regulator of sigma E protease
MMLSSILVLVIAFLSLIALMIIHEFGHFIIAKKFGVRVDEFGIGYPPRIFGKKIGETIYSINWIPLGAFVRIYGEEGGVDDYRSFQNLKIWQRVLIVIGGVAAFWITAIIIFSIVFGIGAALPVTDQDVPELINPQVIVTAVSANSPASQAGLKMGDVITEVKIKDLSVKIDKIGDFQKIIGENKGKEITLAINRSGKAVDFNLTPRANPPAGQGATGVGLERMASFKKYPLYYAPVQGAVYTWKTTVNAVEGLYSVFANLISQKGLPKGAEFAGPLGITIFLANAASYGLGFFLYFIGTLSVLIAIFNLFPIPALDGGKLIFLLIEKIKGKPVSPQIEQVVTFIFFAILICLSIYITIRFDIPRFADFLTSSLQR